MTARKRRGAMIVAVPLGLLVSGALVYQSSSAAFTDSTWSPVETWAAGSVALTDNSNSSLLWTAQAGLKPGVTATRCVLVTYSGSLDANISFYPTSYAATDTTSADLQDWLKFTVVAYDGDQTAATTDGCKASMPTALTLTNPINAEPAATLKARTAFAAGARTSTAVTPTAPHYITYQITYLVDNGATNEAQNDTVALAFTWEAQNT